MSDSSDMPQTISVCIPAHNEERTIGMTIESLLDQEGIDANSMEILVGANACTDGTSDEVRRLQAIHPDVIQLLEIDQKGKPNTWNVLVEAANHDHVIFVDGDVRVDSKAIAAINSMLRDRDDLVIVQGTNAAVLRELNWITKLSVPRPNRPDGILVKEWQDTICGRMYGFTKSRLLDVMSELGFDRMPDELIHEDGWLRRVLDLAASRHRNIPLERVLRREGRYWEVCRDALVYFVPPDRGEDAKISARTMHAREQLNAMFPEYAAAIRQSQAKSKKGDPISAFSRLLFQMSWSERFRVVILRLLRRATQRKARRLFDARTKAGDAMSAETFARSETSKRQIEVVTASAPLEERCL